jgi:hypothetical protein
MRLCVTNLMGSHCHEKGGPATSSCGTGDCIYRLRGRTTRVNVKVRKELC